MSMNTASKQETHKVNFMSMNTISQLETYKVIVYEYRLLTGNL